MAKTPFKLKSGNRSAFKELGSTSLSFEELSDKIADDVNTVNQNLKDHFDYEGTGQTKWKGEREGKGTMKKDEKGLTKMERDRAELKDRRRNYSGMSKYKADIIRKREERKAAKKTEEVKSEVKTEEGTSEKTAKTTKKTTKVDKTKTGFVGSPEMNASYIKYLATFDEYPDVDPMTREQWELYGDY